MIEKISKIESLSITFVIYFLLCCSVAGWPQTISTHRPAMPTEIYDKLELVTVNIICDNGKKNGSGSIIGVTTDGRALILTACHVVAMNFDPDEKIELEFHKNLHIKKATEDQPIRAKVLRKFVNKKNDLALIQTDDPVAVNHVISYNRVNRIKSGQIIAAYGYPGSEHLQEKVGRITSINTTEGSLEFDATIEVGHSGGPLVDQCGRMIGMVTALNSALPMNQILTIWEVWQKDIKLQKEWKHQKYCTILERTYKNPYCIAGEIIGVGGVVLLACILSDKSAPIRVNNGFPMPPGRP